MKKAIVTVTLNPAIDETVIIDNFTAGNVNRVKTSERNAGGKGINVATFISDYGLSAIASGFLGADNDMIFKKHFIDKAIADWCVRINGSTRTGIKIASLPSNETTDINYPGIAPNESELEKLKKTLLNLAKDYEWFALSGSVPAGVDKNIYRELTELLKAKGCQVMLDTSGEPFTAALQAEPDIIKPNVDELAEYTGKKLDSQAAVLAEARALMESGITTVIVSMGSEGAIFVEGNEAIYVQPPKVEVKSTVGAGDAMVAGTLCGKLDNLSLAETAVLATSFSVNAVTSIKLGITDKAELKNIQNQVKINKL
ncbi:MAG: 1-phosphofructokinase [Spirochaetes bacterium]|nr:1-phosphofructokinase [Spirochaetota bacterium]